VTTGAPLTDVEAQFVPDLPVSVTPPRAMFPVPALPIPSVAPVATHEPIPAPLTDRGT
jgi:hypothetical protein